MRDEFEEKWEKMQIANWKCDEEKIVTFFKRFDLDIRDVFKQITGIDYKRMQTVCYLLSKIDKAIKICDFLDTLEKNSLEDVDIIKIYILTSHAEIASRSLCGKETKLDLVRRFFKPVESNLENRIIMADISLDRTLDMNFAYILYKIRCEYTHEGNYIGRLFKRNEDGASSLLFCFNDDSKKLCGICGITYQEFLKIYMRALIENIKVYCDYTPPIVA